MKNGSTTLKTVKNGVTQIKKIVQGTKVIWENWKLITSSKFTIFSGKQEARYITYWNETPKVNTPGPIKIRTCSIKASDTNGLSTVTQQCKILGYTADGTRHEVYTWPTGTLPNSINGTWSKEVTVSKEIQELEFVKLYASIQGRSDLIVTIHEARIDSYYQKGN